MSTPIVAVPHGWRCSEADASPDANVPGPIGPGTSQGKDVESWDSGQASRNARINCAFDMVERPSTSSSCARS